MSEDNLDGRHYGFSGITLSGPVQLSTRLETIGGVTWGLYGSVCVCVCLLCQYKRGYWANQLMEKMWVTVHRQAYIRM